MSLNSNDATIWERQGHEWKQTETLTEVRTLNTYAKTRLFYGTSYDVARQADHLHRLGPQLEPYRHLRPGP